MRRNTVFTSSFISSLLLATAFGASINTSADSKNVTGRELTYFKTYEGGGPSQNAVVQDPGKSTSAPSALASESDEKSVYYHYYPATSGANPDTKNGPLDSYYAGDSPAASYGAPSGGYQKPQAPAPAPSSEYGYPSNLAPVPSPPNGQYPDPSPKTKTPSQSYGYQQPSYMAPAPEPKNPSSSYGWPSQQSEEKPETEMSQGYDYSSMIQPETTNGWPPMSSGGWSAAKPEKPAEPEEMKGGGGYGYGSGMEHMQDFSMEHHGEAGSVAPPPPPPPPPAVKGSIDYILIPLILIGIAAPVFVVVYVILGSFESKLAPIAVKRSMSEEFSSWSRNLKPATEVVWQRVSRALDEEECMERMACYAGKLCRRYAYPSVATGLESALLLMKPKSGSSRSFIRALKNGQTDCKTSYKCKSAPFG